MRWSRQAWAVAVAGGLVLAVAAPAAAWDGSYVSPAVLVVGSPGALSPGDLVVQAELTDMGYEVSVVDDGAAAGLDPDTAVVVLTPSVDGVVLGQKYRNVTVPVLSLGNAGWTELAMTSGGGGVSYSTATLLVVDSTHPIAAGLPGTFAPATVGTSLQSVNEPYLPAGAEPVAVRSGTTVAHVVYTVAAGATRSDGTAAPAPRAILGLTEETLVNLSGDGNRLLDNAVYWCDDQQVASAAIAAAAQVKGRWNLDTINGQRLTPDAIGTADGVVGATVTVTGPVAPTSAGKHAVSFPGWADGDTNQSVDVDNSLVSAPDRAGFDPGTSSFTVTFWVRAKDSRTAVQVPNGESPNMVQKGLSNTPGGFWKVGLLKDMTPLCAVRSGADVANNRPGTEVRPNRVTNVSPLDPDGPYQITCTITNTSVTIKVKRANYPLASGTVSRLAGSIANDRPVSIGKKPGSSAAGDAFAGVIDNLVISKAA